MTQLLIYRSNARRMTLLSRSDRSVRQRRDRPVFGGVDEFTAALAAYALDTIEDEVQA